MANAWEKFKQRREEQKAEPAVNGATAWENVKKTMVRPAKVVMRNKTEETGKVSSLPAVAAIDPLALLGGSSTVTPASLVKGEMTGVGAKAEHQMASDAAEEAESALEKLRSAQTAANMAANPVTGEAVAKSAGYSSLADLNKAVSDAEDALKDAAAGRDAAAQRYYDLMGRKAMGGAAASDTSVFNEAVEAAAEVLAIRDTYRYGGWTNDATSALAAAQEKKQKAIETLTAAGVDKEDAERAVDYAAQQKRAQAAAEKTAATKEWADEHPVGATALSVLSSPAQGLDYVSAALGNIGHNSTKDVENYKPLTGADFPITGETQALREGASADMGAVGKFFYDTGMSLVDSSLLIYTVGPAAGVILGMGAAASAAKDALERGGTNDQALLSGLAAGAAEMIFEEVSIEKLLSIKDVDSGRILLTNVLKQAGAEAQEEAATEIANILFDGVIMGQTSNFNRAVQAYMADGMDESEAKKQAYLDNLEQVILAAAGGALSGGVSALARGGAMYTANKVEQNAVERAAAGEQQELSGPTQENAETAAQGAAVTGQQGQESAEADMEGTGTPEKIVAENAIKTAPVATVGVHDLRGADGRLQLRSLIGDEELEYLDKLSRAANVPINVVEARRDGVQGWYENGQIYIAENAEDPFGEVAKHELTHHLQQMAPAEYGEYRELAGRIMTEEYGAEGVEKLIADLQEKHAGQGLELSREGALDELAADFTQRLLVDEDMFRRVARENRNLAQRLLDSLREFLRKVRDTLTHRQLSELEQAEQLWEAALRESVRSGGEHVDIGTRFSINNTRNLSMKEQMSLWRSGEMTKHDEFYHGPTPVALSAAGLGDGPLVMSQTDFKKSRSEKHNVPTRTIAGLAKDLEDPVLSFETETGIGVLTKNIDGDGKPLLIGIAKNVDLDGESVNRIKSAYGLDDPQAWIKNQVEGGKTLRIYDEKRADSFLNGFGYKAERSENFHSGDIVTEIRSEVKDDNESRARTFQEEVQAQMTSQAQRYAAPEYGSTEETAKGIAEREVGQARNRAAETLSNASEDSVSGEAGFVNTDRTFQEEVQAQMMGEIAEKERAAPFKTGTSSERGLPGGDAQYENSVAENAEEVNTDKQYSIQGTRELQQQMADLQKQNQRLEERNRRLKEQMKRSGRATTDEVEVKRTAAQLLKDLSSRYDKGELGSRLQRLYDSMADPGQAESLSQAEIHREARNIAEAVLSEVSVLNDDLYQEYSDLRKYLRTTKINVPQSLWGELEIAGGYNEFRRRNMGRLSLSSTEGRAVEDVYQELSYDYPGLFDQDAVSHPGDQLLQLAEVLDSLKPVYENPYAADQRNAADWLAGEIMERFYDLPQTAPTFADRAAAKVDAARAEERQAAQERFRKALADQEERNQRKLKRIRESNRQANARMRENMTVTKLRDTIKRHAEGLSRKLLRPTDKQHIPEGLRGSVLALLEVVDLESKYGYEFTREATFRRVNRSENPNTEPTKRTAAARALAAEYRALSENPEFNGSIDPDLVDKLEEIAKMGDIRVADMNREQLQTVWETVRAVESSVTKADKMLGESKYQKISAAADQLRADVGNRKDRKNLVGALGKGDQLLNLDMLTPETFLHRLGDVGDELHRQMRRAQDKNIGILSEGIDFYKRAAKESGVDVLQAEKENHEFKLPGGTIELTTAQVMDLYGLSKRQQAMEHIYKGGLRAKGGRKGIYKVGSSAAVKANYEDVATILEVLTPEQKAFVDKLQSYMSTQLAAHGNEASMEAYGYEKFKEKNYWPIKVSNTETDTDPAQEARAKTIPGFGMTKALQPHASNSVTLRSALDTYSEHLNQMATYAAWLITSENITKLQNYDFMESGQRTGTVKALFEKVYGEGGGKYLENLLSDVAQGSKTGSESTFSDAMLGRFKAAKVGANLRVILQQPTALLRAAEMLDLKYLDTWGNPLKGWERAKQWAPIARWKDWGYFEMDAGRSMRELMAGTENTLDKVKNAAMAGAGLMDNVAWGHLWNAVEAETANEHSDLKAGTDEYYRHVAERFGEIIDRTQVVDSVLHRTQIMRSTNAFNRLATSFMSEPSKVYNMVLRDVYDLIHTEKGSRARKRAAKNVARTGAALVASFAVNAVAQSLVDALRDDDREKDYLEKLGDAYGENFFSNFDPLGYIPYIKDVESIIQGFTVERSDLEGIADFVQACETMGKVIAGKSTKTPLNAGMDLALKALDAIGLPGSNIKRDVTALLSAALQAAGADWATYQMDKLLLDIDHSSNAGVFYDTLYRAMSNDWDTYTRIYWDMVASGLDPVRIASAMEKRMAEGMGLSKASALPIDYSAPGENKAFDQIVQEQLMGGMALGEVLGDRLQLAYEIDALTPEDGESGVTDAQRRREIADSIFGESVKEIAMEQWMSESAYERYMAAREAGVSTYEYINLLEDIEAATLQRRGKKGSASQADVLKALQTADLTVAQKRAVWYSYGYKTESPWG